MHIIQNGFLTDRFENFICITFLTQIKLDILLDCVNSNPIIISD